MLHSELFGGIVDYAVCVTNGNGPLPTDNNKNKEIAGYLGLSPLDSRRASSVGFRSRSQGCRTAA